MNFTVYTCLCSLMFVTFTAVSAEQLRSDSDTAISATLQSMEQAWANAEKNHNPAVFEKLVADDWIAITPDGKRQTKAQRSAKIKTSHLGSVELGPMDVRVYGDTAIVTGTVDETTPEKGAGAKHHYAWTDVFVKRNGKWLAVASQTALIQ